MWWLIPIGIGLKLIYDALSDDEREARQNWEHKRAEVEQSIEEHQKNIETHISEAQSSYDFYFLIDLHYSSTKIADVSYRLLNDARVSLSAMDKMLLRARQQRERLQKTLKHAKIVKDNEQMRETVEQLKMVSDLRKNLFQDRDKVKEQKCAFFSELSRLNNQTRQLKELIRCRCGPRGQDWFNRLEQRKQLRLISNGRR